MCDGCVFEIVAEEGADEFVGGDQCVGEFGGSCGAVFYGGVGAEGRDLGVTSDLCGFVWDDGGVLGGFAKGGEEEGVGVGKKGGTGLR